MMKFDTNILSLIILALLSSTCGKKDTSTIQTISTPLVSTTSISDVTTRAAVMTGNVSDASNGHLSARGICWSINEGPSVDDVADGRTVNGTDLGDFTARLDNLTPGTKYFARAYATNEVGTGYGNEITFNTPLLTSFTYNGKQIYVHPTDNGILTWGSQGVTTAATSTNSGSDNTNLIDQQLGPYAAKTCADLVAYGYSDWYLPSSDELVTMAEYKVVLENFNQQEYWSSTETGSNTASSVDFVTTNKNDASLKNTPKSCRCVRKD